MLTTTPPKMNRPRRCTIADLQKVNVVLLDEDEIRLACRNCGSEWTPNLRQKGRLPKGYWTCPAVCNVQS